MNGLDLGPLTSALLGVLVLVGTITGVVIVAVRAKPGELMADNTKLRQEVRDVDKSLSELSDAFDEFKRKQRLADEEHDKERREDRRRIAVLVDGVNTMWGCLSVLRDMLTAAGQVAPEWSESVRQTMEAARDAAQDGL